MAGCAEAQPVDGPLSGYFSSSARFLRRVATLMMSDSPHRHSDPAFAYEPATAWIRGKGITMSAETTYVEEKLVADVVVERLTDWDAERTYGYAGDGNNPSWTR